MGKDTGISWTDHTFNLAWGCTKVSSGCQNCYAETFSNKIGFSVWGKNSERRIFGASHWKEPLKWDKEAFEHGRKDKVFCSSMCDIFEDHPTINAERPKLWDLIQATPNLIWQLLTKRAERLSDPMILPVPIAQSENVWGGVSAENQEWWERRVPLLIQSPFRVKFVSVEPLLGPIVPGQELKSIDWVIIGGESGFQRRQCETSMIVNLANRCWDESVACWVKQDSHSKPGKQGRLSDDVWEIKQFPLV